LKVEDIKGTQNYFEFHFKVPVTCNAEWDAVRDLCLPFGAHLFFNSYSKGFGYMQPVVTLRRYDVDYKTAEADCQDLIKAVVAKGFEEPEKVHHEFSVLDTDVHYDENWLFTGDPRNFIRELVA